MTPEQVVLVKNSWALFAQKAEKVAEIFYNKVFELDPPLQPLFKGNMTEQGRKIMEMIDTVVNSLDRLEAIFPNVELLGERHAHYGVKDQDYEVLGAALLWTLETQLGQDFTAETKNAWTIVYHELSRAMKSAASAVTESQDLPFPGLEFT